MFQPSPAIPTHASSSNPAIESSRGNLLTGLRIPLLCPEEAASYADLVLTQRNHWEEHSPAILYSLGSPAYQNSADISAYYAKARSSNHFLFQLFGALYGKVLHALAQVLESTPRLIESVAIPGFHIFTLANGQRYKGGGAHFDLSYTQLNWHCGTLPASDSLSFTVSLQAPRCSAGLERWDILYDDVVNTRAESAIGDRRPHFFPMQVGEIFLFSGNYKHRIAPMQTLEPFDFRITMQGHLLRVNQDWLAYW